MTGQSTARARNEYLLPGKHWDATLSSIGGHLLQSWRWGEFKSRHGWQVERVATEGAEVRGMAQILFRRRGPFSLGYVPRGPAINSDDQDLGSELIDLVDHACKRRRCLNVIIEPDGSLPFTGTYRQHGFVRGPDHFQPARTVKVPLLDDEALLAQMHQKTRYSVRLAERRDVAIRAARPDEDAVGDFYRLLLETSNRNQFGIHGIDYYRDFLQTFEETAVLLFAYIDDKPAAALIAARFACEAIYMYGASSSSNRGHGAAFALQFEAMRWARGHGCTSYDLWGIPAQDPPSTETKTDRVAATRGEDWRGLHKFKTGFGGRIVSPPPTLERRYHPILSFVARRLYAIRAG